LSVEWEEMLSRLDDLLPDAAERELELEELRRLLTVWQSFFQKLYSHYMSANPPSAMPVAGYMWQADMWACIKVHTHQPLSNVIKGGGCER